MSDIPGDQGGTAPQPEEAPLLPGEPDAAPTRPDLTAPSSGEPPAPPPRRLGRLLLIVGAAVVVLAGAASAGAFFLLKGSPDTLDHLVPASTSVYVTAYLDPGAGQKLNLLRLSRKFPDLTSSKKLDERIDQALDDVLSGSGLTAGDIRPWLGSQMAVAVKFKGTQPEALFLIGSKDEAATQAAFEKSKKGPAGSSQTWSDRSYLGVTISVGSSGGEQTALAVVDHTGVIANDPAFIEELIDTSRGKKPTLSSTANFTKTVAPLPESRLGLAYVNLAALVPQIKEQLVGSGLDLTQLPGGLGQLDAYTGLGATLVAQPNGMALSVTVATDPGKLSADQRELLSETPGPNSVLTYTPQKTFGIFALTGFDKTAASIRDQAAAAGDESFQSFDRRTGLSVAIDHLSGDAGFEVGPGTVAPYPSGALLFGVDDQTVWRTFLDRVADDLSSEIAGGSGTSPASGPTWDHVTYQGVDIATVHDPDLEAYGVSPSYAVTSDMAIIASSLDEAEAAIDAKGSGATIVDAPTFKQAVGSTTTDQLLYVDIGAVVAAVRDSLSPEDQQRFDSETAPNLRPLKAYVQTSTADESRTSLRIFLLIQ